MTTERMLELLNLTNFLEKHKNMLTIPGYTKVVSSLYNVDLIIERRNYLESELLAPYVIDNTPKGD